MSITTTKIDLLPVRRDGQISSGNSTVLSGSGSSGGGGGVTPFDPTPVYTYVDGSLALRDLSINNLYSIKANLTDLYPFATNASIGLFKTNYIDPSLNAKVNKAGDTMTGDLTVNTNVIVKGKVNTDTIDSSLSYVSGYAGAGFKLSNTSGKITLEIDNIKVRNTISAYKLEINEITSVNGGLIISPANGIPYSVVGTRFYFDETNGNQIQFAVNDYVKAQTVSTSYVGIVTNVVHSATLGSAYIDATTQSGTPYSNMKLCQIGNSSDTARQNVIYITATDTNNPYIDMLSGVNAGSFTGKQRVRIGNLTGITDAAFGGALSGYGIYADNVYLKGKLVIASGTSGYSNISDKPTIPSNTNQLTDGANLGGTATWSGVSSKPTIPSNTNQLTDGANLGGTAAWGGLSGIPSTLTSPGAAGLYLTSTYMGYWNGGSWVNYMDNAGNASFTGIATIGTTAQSGSNCTIMGASLSDTAYAGDGGTMYINYMGYQGGSSYFRNFIVGNGKGNNGLLIYATGNPKRVAIASNSAPDSTFQVATTNGAGLKINYNEGGTNYIYGATTSDSNITATNFTGSSDERLKVNIETLRFKHIPIKYKSFELKSELGQKRVGVIAQDLQKTNPEFVREDKEGFLSVAYIDLLMAKVAELEARVKELEGR
jgi:hypothetical protein